MLQLVQSSAARPAGEKFSGFVSLRHHAAKPEKFRSIEKGGLKGRLLEFCHLSHEVESPGGAGIQPAAGFSPPSWYATNFSGFVSLKCCAAKPEKFVSISRKPAKSRLQPERPPHEKTKAGCGLKGRLQARLPATRKSQSRVVGGARRRLSRRSLVPQSRRPFRPRVFLIS